MMTARARRDSSPRAAAPGQPRGAAHGSRLPSSAIAAASSGFLPRLAVKLALSINMLSYMEQPWQRRCRPPPRKSARSGSIYFLNLHFFFKNGNIFLVSLFSGFDRETEMTIWRTGAALAAFLAFSPLHAADQLPADTTYDIVIRNGRVLDGNGNPWVRADIAIQDGKFAKIGRVEGRGKREIDAKGEYVSPGWIDMMDQSGEVLQKNGL